MYSMFHCFVTTIIVLSIIVVVVVDGDENCWQTKKTLKKCVDEVSENWSCIIQLGTDEYIQSSSSNQTINKPKLTKQILMNCGPNEPMICCPIWNFINCIRDVCSTNPSSYMDDISEIQRKNCPNFHYDSIECEKYGQFIRNQFMLDLFDDDKIVERSSLHRVKKSILHYKNNINNQLDSTSSNINDDNDSTLATMSLPKFTTKITILNPKLTPDLLRTLQYLLFWIIIYVTVVVFGPFLINDIHSSDSDQDPNSVDYEYV